MQDESVWFEQVDEAFLHYIQSVVRIADKNGNISPVPVSIRKADEDFKIESYPSITLYNLYSYQDIIRYYPEPIVVARDTEAGTVTVERGAIPYTLHYQLDFWSRFQSDMNEMTRLWLSKHPSLSFNLPVKDMSGKDRVCVVLVADDLKKMDQLSSLSRNFHSVLTYKVKVELDSREQTVGPMIQEIDIIT